MGPPWWWTSACPFGYQESTSHPPQPTGGQDLRKLLGVLGDTSVGALPELPTPWPAGNRYGTCSKALPMLKLRLPHASSEHW